MPNDSILGMLDSGASFDQSNGPNSGLLHVNGGPGISLLLPDESNLVDQNYANSAMGQLDWFDMYFQTGAYDQAIVQERLAEALNNADQNDNNADQTPPTIQDMIDKLNEIYNDYYAPTDGQ